MVAGTIVNAATREAEQAEAAALVVRAADRPPLAPGAASIDLWDYAEGDGVTDDTEAINFALALAVSRRVRRVNCGGPERTYLLGGPFVRYGTFPAPGGPVPFNRHKLRLYSNLEIVGQGARFRLAPGATYPGGIFGHPFWEGERLADVRIEGVVLDGDATRQRIPPIPASTHDNSVWQHGNAITGCFDGLEVANCVFRDLRGHGINLNWASGTPDDWARPQHIEVHHNEFVDVFTQACNAGGLDTRFHHNRLHGNGFWVAGLDIESGDPAFPVRGVHSYANTYDFAAGLSPPESAPAFASASAEARSRRRHTRRAIAAYCPPFPRNVWTGTTDDILIEDETIRQGIIAITRFGHVKVRRVRIDNPIVEDLAGHMSASPNAISITAEAEQGIGDCEVVDCKVDSALAGSGIYAHGIAGLTVRNNELRGMDSAAIRLEGCSGLVSGIVATDFGADDSGSAWDMVGSFSSAVTVYGGQREPLRIENVTAVDTRRGAQRKARHVVYANVAAVPATRVENCMGRNILGEVVRDVNGTTGAA